jgi:hypothetical protein
MSNQMYGRYCSLDFVHRLLPLADVFLELEQLLEGQVFYVFMSYRSNSN